MPNAQPHPKNEILFIPCYSEAYKIKELSILSWWNKHQVDEHDTWQIFGSPLYL